MALTFAPFRNLDGIITKPSATPNVSFPERIGSASVGVLLITYALTRRNRPGVALGLLGGVLLHRAITGRCAGYRQLGIDNASASNGRGVAGNEGVKVEKSIEIARAPMELYHFWHQLSNLPEIMPHVKSVTVNGSRSHWVVAGPLGRNVEWDAEFINEKPGQMIAWQSLPGADVQSAGSVHFDPVNGDEVTRVRVSLEYLPPAGKAGAFLAHLLGAAPDQQLENDLSRFKERMEAA